MLVIFYRIWRLYHKWEERRRFAATKYEIESALRDSAEYFLGMSDTDRRLRNFDAMYKTLDRSQIRILRPLIEAADKLSTPAMRRVKWLIGVSDVEDEMPHTLGNVIFLPTRFFEFPRDRQIYVLLHEKVHVLTRRYPNKYEDIFLAWGFTPAEDRPFPHHARSNPDIDHPYYFNGRLLAEVYVNNPQSLSSTQTILLDEDTMEVEILPPAQRDREHPNEILADAVASTLIKNGLPSTEKGKPIRISLISKNMKEIDELGLEDMDITQQYIPLRTQS